MKSNNPNTNKLIGGKWVSQTSFQYPQRSRRIAGAGTRLSLGQPESGNPGPAGTSEDFSQGALTNALCPPAAKAANTGFLVPVLVALKHNWLQENPV